MTARVVRLEQAGLVARLPDPADGRAVRVQLTSRGEEVATRALGAMLEADENFLAPLSDPERDTVASMLRSLLLHCEQQSSGGAR